MSKRKTVAMQIAEHFGWDVADIKPHSYHDGWYSPKVYCGMDGNRYWSAGPRKPKYARGDDGLTWRKIPSSWPDNPPLWVGE